MTKKDYYEILNISRSANDREIKRAYKRLAVKYHPDRNKNSKISEKKFKEIKQAYEILIDPKKRETYDQYGHSAFEQNTSENDFHESFTTSTDFGDIFGDVFGDIFGNNRRSYQKGSDLEYEITLNLEEAVTGTTKEVYIPALQQCHACHGTKSQLGTQPEKCQTCHGTGNIHMRKGFFTVQQTCPSCHGNKIFIKHPCNICNGIGKIKKTKKLSIKIPPGVDNHDKIKLNNEGEIGENGLNPGDLYINIKIKKHNIFTRKKNNLYCEIPISFPIAALGGEVQVPTLNGKIKLKIPAETQSGKLFRVKGKGVQSIRHSIKGDLLCKIVVETPINLSSYQKNLLYEFKNSLKSHKNEKNSPRSKRFFDGVKKFFDNLTQ
ncbi:molecular chaperone DnaJ [Buchnera aphidicola]|uniref:molecular chaperone DnaJ n=1 Tax=Buchnera aphidicola TaxID=9 RepID=UPI002092E272|nr:molecular chaperone DnaJ [Buchnera aphidicola]USS94235.1 molecular chaperone DnaJ [Buchnera aphidicola (Sipha maydis)]WII23784.1 molecular chaperone DnaJ [Buchnera aphidicola (Sipha maydis)]